jgi:hypothetical protein
VTVAFLARVRFRLDSASEILFSGDAGDTQAIQPSRRYGIKWIGAFATGSMKAAHQIAKGTELQRSSKPRGRVPTWQHNSFGDRGGIEIFRFSILLGTVLILVLRYSEAIQFRKPFTVRNPSAE